MTFSITSPYMLDTMWAIPLYPLVAFAIIVLGRWAKIITLKAMTAGLVITSTLLGLVHTLMACWVFKEESFFTPVITHSWKWLAIGPLNLQLGLHLDASTFVMLLVVTTVSVLIQLYTHGYMDHDKGYHRFYAYLTLFNFSMLSLVLSGNLFQMYIFWELVGVSSYLLIGFWTYRPSAGAAATKAFLMNRVGDFGLLLGILMFLYYSFQGWLMHPEVPLLSFSAMPQAGEFVLRNAGPFVFTVICLLIFMGPVAKSAQLPLHTWLPDAMEGPTPISALIHAATMVAAGVYLISRMYPVFSLSPQAMTVIAWVGALTALVAATIALTQYDIKKALAYSTMSQLGYMVMAMGIGAVGAGLFHLVTHAYFKAMLFLCSGSVIHGCHEEQDMRRMGGLFKFMPITAITYLIGTMAITGFLPFLSGFWSKDEIIASAFAHQPILFLLALTTAGLTSFYMYRTYFLTFTGSYRGEAHPHESQWPMWVPLVVLAVPSIALGGFLSGFVPGVPSFEMLLHPELLHHPHGAHEHTPNFLVMGVSMLVALGGFLLAWITYGRLKLFSPDWLIRQGRPVYELLTNKWYFDALYSGIARCIYLPFAELSAWFDRTVVDGMVTLTSDTVNLSADGLRRLQSGRIQTYLLLVVAAVMALTLWVLLGQA